MKSSMESRMALLPFRILGAAETERVGAMRSHDLQVGHTMGPPPERPQRASCVATSHRCSGLTTLDRLRYINSAEATPEIFHGTRDTTGFPWDVMTGEYDYSDRDLTAPQLREHLKAINVWHHEIKENDIRALSFDDF